MMTEIEYECDGKMRPFVGTTEIRCERKADGHEQHAAVLLDAAYPGSETRIVWFDSDRRTFHGDWPGDCEDGCILPFGHRGNHTYP